MKSLIRRGSVAAIVSAAACLILMATPAAASTTYTLTHGLMSIDVDGDSASDVDVNFTDESECPGESMIFITTSGNTVAVTGGSFAPGHFALGGNHYILEIVSVTGMGTVSGTALSGTVNFTAHIYRTITNDCTTGEKVCDDITAELTLTGGSTHTSTTTVVNGSFTAFDIIGDCDAAFAGLPFGGAGTVTTLTLEHA